MYNPRWGAFYRTPLAEHLAGLGVDSLVVCGCNFPNCPRTTVYEASERDFRLALVTDATSGLYARGARELADIGVRLFTAQECAAWVAESEGEGGEQRQPPPGLSVGPERGRASS